MNLDARISKYFPQGDIEVIFILLVTTQNLMGLLAVTEALSLSILNQDSKFKEHVPVNMLTYNS